MGLARFARFGTNAYAPGGSGTSAPFMGLPAGRAPVKTDGPSGFLPAPAGIVVSSHASAGYSPEITGGELDTTTIVVGGALPTGGFGTMVGTTMEALVRGVTEIFIAFDGSSSS